MKKWIKRLLKIFAAFVGLLIVLMIAIPLLFGKQIKEAVVSYVNTQLDAKVSVGDVGISMFRNFPNLTVQLDDFVVVGKGEFEGDTLVSMERFNVVVNLWSVVFGSKYEVRKIQLDQPRIFAQVSKTGKASWDIYKSTPDSSAADTSKGSSVALSLYKYGIYGGHIVYDDRASDVYMKIANLDHYGSGDFENDNYDFYTQTTADSVTFRLLGTRYLRKAKINFDVDLNIDQKAAKYTFRENSFAINDLVVGLDGFVQMTAKGANYDFKYSTKQNTFSNLLSMVPGMYTKDFANIKTDGTFTLNGWVKGSSASGGMPGFGLDMSVVNGWFQYPDLPEAVKDINFSLNVNCPDGDISKMTVKFPKFHALFGKAPVDAKCNLSGLTTDNMNIDASAKASLELTDLMKMFPMEGQELRGKFTVDGTATGVYNSKDGVFPKVAALLKLENGYYKTSAFPSAIDKLAFNGSMNCPTAQMADASIDLSTFHAEIDGEPVDGRMKLNNFNDVNFDIALKGKLNLEKLNKIYPLEGTTMKGIVTADVQSQGKQSDISSGAYTRITSKGSFALQNLLYSTVDFPQGFKVNEGLVNFTPKNLEIKTFNGALGTSAVSITGALDNYLAYVFLPDQLLRGNMSLTSPRFNVNEWMTESSGQAAAPAPAQTAPAPPGTYSVYEVPANLDFTFNCSIGEVLYDNLVMKNFKGTVILRDRKIMINNAGFNALDGSFSLPSGTYSTENPAEPRYDFNFVLSNVNIKKAYDAFPSMQQYAPVAKFMTGTFNANFDMKGLLGQDMMPQLKSLSSDGNVDVLNATVKGFKVLDLLAEKTKINELGQMAIAKTRVFFKIQDGKLFLQDALDLKLGKSAMKVNKGGWNAFDGGINYDVDFDIPAGAVGSTAINSLSGLTGKSVSPGENIKLSLGLGGTADKPKITRVNGNLAQGIKDEVKDEIKDKVDDVKDEVKDKVDDAADKAKEEADRLKREAEEKAKAEAERLKAEAEAKKREAEAKAKAEADRLKKEAEQKAKEEAEKLKNKLKFPK